MIFAYSVSDQHEPDSEQITNFQLSNVVVSGVWITSTFKIFSPGLGRCSVCGVFMHVGLIPRTHINMVGMVTDTKKSVLGR